MVGAGELLHDSSGFWILGFSPNMGIATNNIAKLVAVRQGLLLAWELGFKFVQLEIDSITILSWLTDTNSTYPPDVLSLICDCRSLIGRVWEMQARNIYHEANKCTDALAKQGTPLTAYSDYL